MGRTIVGVLRGGSSSEYEHSLKSGASILNALPEDRYDTRDIFVDRSGLWHSRGMPAEPMRALSQVDVVLNMLHGGAGEDGTVQRILERAGIPYAGSRVLASNVSMNKILSRAVLSKTDITIPRGITFGVHDGTTADMALAAFSLFPAPYIVKAPSEGSSTGILIAETILELPDAIGDILDLYGKALVEEFIRGEEVTVAIVEDFRNEPLYAFPPAHIALPDTARYLQPEVLAQGSHKINVPSNFTHDEKRALIETARRVHQALGMSHFSNVDMILPKHGNRLSPYVLEANSVPILHEKAPLSHMLESVGSSLREFAEHSIALAQKH